MRSYLQPLAHHLDHPERLLLRGGDGRFFVWRGESAQSPPEEIEPRLATWLVAQERVEVLAPPLMWLHVDDLPLAAPVSSPSPSIGRDAAR
ncbi:MAG: hypothetical protein H0T49_04145 [Chloroflexia bacterium]|jgi:hypothetical protein|nr:hypothetical protein [Chloroflexia bacterium]